MWPSNSTPRYKNPKELKTGTKNLYRDVCSSTIHNSKKVEPPKSLWTAGWMNKMQFTQTVEHSAVKRNEVWSMLHHGPCKHRAVWKKPDTTSHMLYDSTYMKRPQQANPERPKAVSQLLRTQRRRECRALLMGVEFPSGVGNMSWNKTEWWLHSTVKVLNALNCTL